MKQEEAAYRVMLEATALLNECGELVVVGGWVPEIHFPKQSHIGSIDVDVVLDPSTFDKKRSLHDHLVAAGYRLDSLQHINRIADLENRRWPTVIKKPIRNVRPTY
ncbi:hypothetical protein [Rhodopirellula europaea]|uniref:hypothetical protein n=1 Tax=Rhodopirellula europaea TaxID=1263866 RepID=UPI000587B8D9|nr:hypothetical protein [Rhodopirellula europaea]